MADFRPLLRTEGSFTGDVLRASLAGLVRALEVARDQAPPGDPGRIACDGLIAELAAELGQATPVRPSSSSPPEPTTAPSVRATPTRGQVLTELSQAFLRSAEVATELPGLSLPDRDDSTIWLPLQLALLRLSATAAKSWRQKIQEELRKRAASFDKQAVVTLAGEPDQVVFPGFAGVSGLRLSPSARPDGDLGVVPPGPAQTVARTLTVLLWMMENDPSLHHGLRGLYNFGLTPLVDDLQKRYRAALLARWAAFRDATQDRNAKLTLETWVDLDEAIHSLQHNPPAPASSWWAKLQRQSRDTMIPIREETLAAGHTVQLWDMSGRYADSRQYADEDDQPMPGPVPVGDIVTCLRLYLKIDGRALQGRVFYRGR